MKHALKYKWLIKSSQIIYSTVAVAEVEFAFFTWVAVIHYSNRIFVMQYLDLLNLNSAWDRVEGRVVRKPEIPFVY